MKLLKAYIRTYFVYDVVHALEKIGISRISVFNLAEFIVNGKKEEKIISPEFGTYTPMAKLEVIVKDDKIDEVIGVILDKAKSGEHGAKGDGIIAIMPVEEIISIRTGEKGAKIL